LTVEALDKLSQAIDDVLKKIMDTTLSIRKCKNRIFDKHPALIPAPALFGQPEPIFSNA